MRYRTRSVGLGRRGKEPDIRRKTLEREKEGRGRGGRRRQSLSSTRKVLARPKLAM